MLLLSELTRRQSCDAIDPLRWREKRKIKTVMRISGTPIRPHTLLILLLWRGKYWDLFQQVLLTWYFWHYFIQINAHVQVMYSFHCISLKLDFLLGSSFDHKHSKKSWQTSILGKGGSWKSAKNCSLSHRGNKGTF